MPLRIFPQPVRAMQASRSMRLRHELWHFVRAVWGNSAFPEPGRQILRNLGWALPDGRSPFAPDRFLLLDNYAGEDFLYMHRQMIAMTDQALAAAGEPPISRWTAVPRPGDSDFPVPPPWDYADPADTPANNARTTAFLQRIKADEYFDNTMRIREQFLTDPNNLRRLSLGALGNLAEMTIHNAMHMRWSTEPPGYRPGVDLEDPTGGDPGWDAISYDYLGDTYSSHVNPHFWYLHGWIDNLVQLWADSNRVTDITWTGTWVGGPDLEPVLSGALRTLRVDPAAEIDSQSVSSAVRELSAISRTLGFPTTLIELARETDG